MNWTRLSEQLEDDHQLRPRIELLPHDLVRSDQLNERFEIGSAAQNLPHLDRLRVRSAAQQREEDSKNGH